MIENKNLLNINVREASGTSVAVPFKLKKIDNLKLIPAKAGRYLRSRGYKNEDPREARLCTSGALIKRKGKFVGNETIGFVEEETNKGKYAILNFLFKYNRKKDPSKLYKKIKNYINLNIISNSHPAFDGGIFLFTNKNYTFNKFNKLNYSVRNNIYEFLHESFNSIFSLISKPVFVNRPDKIIIQLFYLFFKIKKLNKKNKNLSKIKSILILEYKNKLNIICNILTRFFHKPVELELVRLNYPYYNAEILVKLIGIFINKIQLRRIVKNFIYKSIKSKSINNSIINKSNDLIPSKLTGITIKVAGRLMTQRVIPRRTVKIISSGALSRNKTMFTETARFTNKNKRGAFSLTVTLGHRLHSTFIQLRWYCNQSRDFQTSSIKNTYLQRSWERESLNLNQYQNSEAVVGLILGDLYIRRKKTYMK